MAAAYRGDTFRAMVGRLFLALVIPAIAHASPRSDPTVGRAVFTGATLPSATSVSLNPAALGLAKGAEFYVAVTSVLEQLGIKRKQIDPTTNDLVDGPEVKDVVVGPGATIAGLWKPGPRTTLGAELRLPPP